MDLKNFQNHHLNNRRIDISKIDVEGLDHLQHIHNALNAIYDKLTSQGDGIFDTVAEEFEYIVEILEGAKHDWEKI